MNSTILLSYDIFVGVRLDVLYWGRPDLRTGECDIWDTVVTRSKK